MQGQPLPAWTRETPWRQGHVLRPDAAAALGFTNESDAANTCVVVVSHDCDLANDNLAAEPSVEVVVGRLVPSPNGNFTWGKAPRTLHLSATRDGQQVTIELVATGKQMASKAVLAPYEPDSHFQLDGVALGVLRSWMGARYNRAAFPDEFVRRMSKTKVDGKLAKALEPHGALISFVYFDLDGGQAIERQDGSPYELSIVLVYNAGNDAEVSADAADKVADAVFEACAKRLTDGSEISLKTCFAISEDDLPVSKARVLMQWRLEYMTLKAADEQLGPLAD